jgi:hypothetical protein
MIFWNLPNNSRLSILLERRTVRLGLPLANGLIDPQVILISGSLPGGLRLENNEIVGTPFEVARETVSTFVLRCTVDGKIQDRTFEIVVAGPDDPIWITNQGLLPVGPNNTFFILDSALIDFQLIATDDDLPAGDELEFYIPDRGGVLPPGITLSETGRLQGVVEPLLALDKIAGTGGYDTAPYGEFPLDFSIVSDNGYGSYFYDTVEYDYASPVRQPKKLNRYYSFTVAVSDGDTVAERDFTIYVVGDDFLTSDNSIMKAADGVFTADVTNIRTPVWLTPSDLGFRRADNYVTLFLDTIDNDTLTGKIFYLLNDFNPDGTPSVLPPGTTIDTLTGEVAGKVPYQPAVTKEYKFTVSATRFEPDVEYAFITATFYEDTLMSATEFKIFKLQDILDDGIDDLNALVGETISMYNYTYEVVAVDNSNEKYDVIKLNSGLNPALFAIIYENTTINQDYFFVRRLTDQERSRWTGRYLRYTASEEYLVQSVFPYIEFDIFTKSGGTIGLDLGWANVPFVPGETTTQTVQRLFERENLPVYVLQADADRIRFVAPKTSLVNIARIQRIFVSEDSLPDDVVHLIADDDRERFKLDVGLQRVLVAGNTLGLGTIFKGSFEKEVVSDVIDEVNTPSSTKTFTVKILGEIDSVITWNTPSNLGSIRANYVSTLRVDAVTTVPNARLFYNVISGKLPNGLTLSLDGEIIGKPRQFGSLEQLGLTTFDGGDLLFDGSRPSTTTFDRVYTFTVKAADRFGFSAIERTFSLRVEDPEDTLYSNLYVKPFLPLETRQAFRVLISDPEIFPPEIIYRPNDPEFGLQKEIKMLAYAGIETKTIDAYVAAAAKHHKRRRYRMGELKTAIAKNPGSNDIVYEVVYLEVVDPAQPRRGETQKTFNIKTNKRITADSIQYAVKDDVLKYQTGSPKLVVIARDSREDISLEDTFIRVKSRSGIRAIAVSDKQISASTRLGNARITVLQTDSEPMRYRPDTNTIKADSDAVRVNSGKDDVRYITNTQNMREELESVGKSNRDFLPLWMRTAQENGIQELDYTTAIPLCYCKPGTGGQVLLNLKNRNFDFKMIDFDIDRYIIDSTVGNSNEQYILFANYQFNA